MGRRGVKEYRAQEALALISTDREGGRLVCPSCGSSKVARTPRRRAVRKGRAERRVTLACGDCGRQALYTPLAIEPAMEVAPPSTAEI